MRELVAFLTDYGTRDGFVAVCHGILARLAPHARVIDVSHDVPPQDVRHGATVLARVAPYLPAAIYVGVVDPGVGSRRRGVAIVAGRDGALGSSVLIGPDNGLLIPAAERLGGIVRAYELTNRNLWLPEPDQTFHGRDAFMPVAGHLAAGLDVAAVGDVVPTEELVRLATPRCERADDGLICEVTYVDRFGNVQLAGGRAELDDLERLATQGELDVRAQDVTTPGRIGRTFADVGEAELLVYLDSDRALALAVNCGDAARRLGVRTGDVVRLARRGAPTRRS